MSSCRPRVARRSWSWRIWSGSRRRRTSLAGTRRASTSWAGAYHECTRVDDVARAARCAFWLAFVLLNKGELARGSGWVHRAQRLLDGGGRDCVEHGYLRYCASLRLAFDGDVAAAGAGFAHAAKIGDRFRDPELVALARVGQGRCLIYRGEIAEGMALLDEAMVAITAQEVSPTAVGDLYCTVIEGCQEVFDVRRAQEWTAALSRWCDSQPELVLYRGQCLVHRAELMLLRGAWSDAATEIQRACDRLAKPTSQRALGAAYYVRADIHRLRASSPRQRGVPRGQPMGRHPQPGWRSSSLLRVESMPPSPPCASPRRGRGRRGAVKAAGPVRRDRPGRRRRHRRTRRRRRAVENRGRVEHAVAPRPLFACDRVGPPAEGTPVPRWPRSAGIGGLARPGRALRRGARPYADRLACRALGDEDSAEMELHAARSVYQQIDAAHDLVRVEELSNIMARPDRGRVNRPRGAGAGAGGDRQDQSGHRLRTGDQREDGRRPCEQHLHQAGIVVPLGCDGLCLRPPSRIGAASTELPTHAHGDSMICPMRQRPLRSYQFVTQRTT